MAQLLVPEGCAVVALIVVVVTFGGELGIRKELAERGAVFDCLTASLCLDCCDLLSVMMVSEDGFRLSVATTALEEALGTRFGHGERPSGLTWEHGMRSVAYEDEATLVPR